MDRHKTHLRGADRTAAELDTACQETVISSLSDPHRRRKRPSILMSESALSGMPHGRRSNIFDEK